MGGSSSQVIGKEYRDQYESGLYASEKLMSDVFSCYLSLYTEIASEKKIACLERVQLNQNFTQNQQNDLKSRIQSHNTSLLKLVGYYGTGQEAEDYCGSNFKQCLYVDYPVGTLRDEIEIRDFLNQPFKEIEIWGVLRSVSNGLAAIKNDNKKCKNVSPSTIYINDEGYYQICELYIVKDSSLMDEIALNVMTSDTYLSPGQLDILKENELHDSTDSYASDVFSLGVTAIDMMCLYDQSDLFQYSSMGGNFGVDLLGLKERLKQLEKAYSKTLLHLIERMIEKKEEDRIKIEELIHELQRNYFRVLQNANEGVEVKRNSKQAQTSIMPYILRRQEYKKLFKKHRNQPKGGANEKNNDRQQVHYISSPVFGDDENELDEQRLNLQNQKGQLQGIDSAGKAYDGSGKTIASLTKVGTEGVPSGAALQAQNSSNKTLIKGIAKIKQSKPKLQAFLGFQRLAQIKQEKEQLLQKQKQIQEENDQRDKQAKLAQIQKQIEDKIQQELELQNAMQNYQNIEQEQAQQESGVQIVKEVQFQDSSDANELAHLQAQAIKVHSRPVQKLQLAQAHFEGEEDAERQMSHQGQHHRYNNRNNNLGDQEYEGDSQFDEHNNNNGEEDNVDERKKSSPYQNIEYSEKQQRQLRQEQLEECIENYPQQFIEEQIRQSPPRSYLDRYDQRINKHNMCTNRYEGACSLFEQKSPENKKNTFTNRFVEKQPIVEIISGSKHSVSQSSRNLSKQQFQVNQCLSSNAQLSLNSNRMKLLERENKNQVF